MIRKKMKKEKVNLKKMKKMMQMSKWVLLKMIKGKKI